DAAGNAYVTGDTTNFGGDFPTTAGAFQTTFAGGREAFALKINPTGTRVLYGTLLRCTRDDRGNGIAVDAAGNAYVAGETQPNAFPTPAGALQTTFVSTSAPGNVEGFVTKLNPSGTGVLYSTYLGGHGSVDGDHAFAVALDGQGNAYVTGRTDSSDFPTVSPLQAALAGGSDAYIAELNGAGSALLFSTYLGGSTGLGTEGGGGIAVVAGTMYVVGTSGSTNFPTTAGAFQTSPGGGLDAFVAKVSPGPTVGVSGTNGNDTLVV